jgi:hypothetical protein
MNQGLIEAFAVQVPERVGKELIELVPSTQEFHTVIDAFIDSIMWRQPHSFSMDAAVAYINAHAIRDSYHHERLLNALLTVAVNPEHPFNADFLHQNLIRLEMADRDSWWSIFLHNHYGTHDSVDRLIDWAWSPEKKDHIDNEPIRLCGVALTWFLTTSNRFVRDRATKALVNLLTKRLQVLQAVMEQFRTVNDLYVLERLFAVAYGCVLRSNKDDEVASTAQAVYDWIFCDSRPPVHILLRDYARGIIEYALHRGFKLDVDVAKVGPPYQSDWPSIPTKEEIEAYEIKDRPWSWDSGNPSWSQNRIYHSVMADDFARYIIGTNTNWPSWLSLRINEPLWLSPEERKDEFLKSLTTLEQEKWEALQTARQALDEQTSRLFAGLTHEQLEILESIAGETEPTKPDVRSTSVIPQLDPAEEKTWQESAHRVDEAQNQFLEALSADKRTQFEADILPYLQNPRERPEEPHFDLAWVQRWILKRVFELGWTVERFGHFDRFAIGYDGREAHKAERIGKKYQWIAYYEFLARMADNFQFREPFSDHPDRNRYVGPWQIHARNIDPSCILRATQRGNVWHPTLSAWWLSVSYDSWHTPIDDVQWMKETSDLPDLKTLVEITRPRDGSQWLALNGFYRWEEPTPPEEESFDVTHREIWYILHSYLIHLSDIDEIFDWANQQDFMGRWMPETRELYKVFLGEFYWSPAYEYFNDPYERTVGWQGGDQGNRIPKPIMPLTEDYLKEDSGFDCSVDESYSIALPCQLMVEKMGLHWRGIEGHFFDPAGNLVASDPSVKEAGPSLLLVDRKSFLKFLQDNNLAVMWTMRGEKQLIGGGIDYQNYKGRLRLSGAYRMLNDKVSGQITPRFDPPTGSIAR